MAANTAQGSGQLYDWGDGHGRVHSRPKKQPAPKPQNIAGKPIWGGMGQIGAGNPAAGYGASPASAPASGPPIQPPDPAYESWKANQGLNAGLAGADATYQHGNLGYETGYNATGQRDYTNPYNAASLLEENYKRAQSGTLNSYASSGQLNSGAYGRMQGENDRNLSIGSNDLQHQASTGHHNIDTGLAQGLIQYGTGVPDQSLAALLRALGVGT